MYNPIQVTTKVPTVRTFISRPPLRRGVLLIPFAIALAGLALSPAAQAVCQQGCDISNLNTFLGEDALISNTTGSSNTAIGFDALYSNTSGVYNTATGDSALQSNTTGG